MPLDALTEAWHLINFDRQDSYGHVTDDYKRVTTIFRAITGVHLHVEQAVLFMVAVKLARLSHNLDRDQLHRDSLIDALGYLALLEQINAPNEKPF
jgi:hypothetical protein